MEPSKSIFTSKTFLVQVVAVLVIIAGQFSQPVADFLSQHFSAVGGGWALVNVVLRLVTKDKVSIV